MLYPFSGPEKWSWDQNQTLDKHVLANIQHLSACPPNAHPAFQTQGTQLPSEVTYFISEQFPLLYNSESHIFQERQNLELEVQKHQELQLTGSPTHIHLNMLASLGDPWSFEVATDSTLEEIPFWTLRPSVRNLGVWTELEGQSAAYLAQSRTPSVALQIPGFSTSGDWITKPGVACNEAGV